MGVDPCLLNYNRSGLRWPDSRESSDADSREASDSRDSFQHCRTEPLFWRIALWGAKTGNLNLFLCILPFFHCKQNTGKKKGKKGKMRRKRFRFGGLKIANRRFLRRFARITCMHYKNKGFLRINSREWPRFVLRISNRSESCAPRMVTLRNFRRI